MHAKEAADFTPPTFNEIYTTTFRTVWNRARRLGVPAHAVEDVVQDVFVVVYRRLDQFVGHCAHETWVLAILKRVVSNYHRKQRRKHAGYAVSSLVCDPNRLVDDRDLFEDVSEREGSRLVRELLERLSEKQAVLFRMAHLEGMTSEEIAQRTSTNRSTVNSRLRAAQIQFLRLAQHFRCHELRACTTKLAHSRCVESSAAREAARHGVC